MLCNHPLFSLHFYACRLSVNHYHEIPKLSLPKIPISLNFPSLERKKITSVSANVPKYIYLKTTNPGMSECVTEPSFFFSSTSLWGIYSETFVHRYNVPLTHAFTCLCTIFFSHVHPALCLFPLVTVSTILVFKLFTIKHFGA